MGLVILGVIVLYLTIYIAIRMAISELLEHKKTVSEDDQEVGLMQLKAIGILNDSEMDEVVEMYRDRGMREKRFRDFQKYKEILDELNKAGFFTVNEYREKVRSLREYYDIK